MQRPLAVQKPGLDFGEDDDPFEFPPATATKSAATSSLRPTAAMPVLAATPPSNKPTLVRAGGRGASTATAAAPAALSNGDIESEGDDELGVAAAATSLKTMPRRPVALPVSVFERQKQLPC
jgi:hypothetical protein